MFFTRRMFDTLTSKELSSEASRLSHYNWHFHDRWMWGETNSQLLQGTYDYQFANIVMRSRNFLPAHTGGFFGSNNTSKEFHWLGSKIAAMDAGTLIRNQGLDDNEKSALKRWNQAAEAGAFSDRQRARMLPWERAYALDEVEAGLRWRLWERGMRLTFDNNDTNNLVTRVDYGHTGGTPELTNPFYVARPWAGFPTRNVAGDALVTASSERAPDFQADNVVDGQIGYLVSSTTYAYEHSEVSEWHTSADDTARWIELTWDSPQKIRAVLLSGRSHPANNVTGYRLEFSSGSPVSGGSLPNRGRYHEHQFTERNSTSLKVVITGHQGTSPGLGEIVVIADDPTFKGDLTVNASIVSGYSGSDGANLFDGSLHSSNTINVGTGLKNIVIDLGDDKNFVDGLNVWKYYDDANRGRTYRDLIFQLSPNRNFSSGVTTRFNNDADNSAGQGAGTDPEHGLLPEGKPIYFPPTKARYVRLWSNGSNHNQDNLYTEVQVYGMKNLAFDITPTTDGVSGTAAAKARATDGQFDGTAHWDVGTELKYVQLDLGRIQAVDSLRVWHYHGDRRRYHDVIFQLSWNDPSFGGGVTTVFNNDLDDSSGLGAGTDGEYYETETGKIVHFAPVHARYVRLYSNGNTRNNNNHYTEVMVGQPGGTPAVLTPALSVTHLLGTRLDGATASLRLTDAETGDLNGLVTVSGVPGVSVASVTRVSATQLLVTLAHDGSEFDGTGTLTFELAAAAVSNYWLSLQASVETSALTEVLEGTPFGSGTAAENARAFDGDTGTHFSSSAATNVHVGIDLGSGASQIARSVRFHTGPDGGRRRNLQGVEFQGSDDRNDWHRLGELNYVPGRRLA